MYYNNTTKQYVVAFKGTDPDSVSDWQTNVAQAAHGATLAQETQAVAIAKKVIDPANDMIFPGLPVTFTGHSLGGGLASYVALELICPAYTFNAAALNTVALATDNLIHLTTATELSHPTYSYYIKGELLTDIQSGFGNLQRPGILVPLNPAKPAKPLTLHSIDSVLLALGLWWYLTVKAIPGAPMRWHAI